MISFKVQFPTQIWSMNYCGCMQKHNCSKINQFEVLKCLHFCTFYIFLTLFITFILESLDAMDPGLTLTQKTPSSEGSWGLPGCPRRPPLTIIPSFSPSSFLTVISMNPAGRGSCWTVSLIISQGCSRDMTASGWVTFLISVVFTARILSPILNLPVAAAEPPGMILLT